MSKYGITFDIPQVVGEVTDDIRHELERRSYLAANELRNAAQEVLRGERSGRRYKVPGTYARQRDETDGKMKNGRYYTASAPGEPPAVRTGAFRLSWRPTARVAFGSYISKIESDIRVGNGEALGDILENGTSKMAPRPYQDAVLEKAEKPIWNIYNQPYF